MCRNFLPRLVLTFELKGGLYHVMFLLRFLLFFGVRSCKGLSTKKKTELSKYVWTLQDDKKSFKIKWTVLKKCKPYSNISKKCNLCLYEKVIIICKKELCSLNRRNELASSCPHRNNVLWNFRVTQLKNNTSVT